MANWQIFPSQNWINNIWTQHEEGNNRSLIEKLVHDQQHANMLHKLLLFIFNITPYFTSKPSLTSQIIWINANYSRLLWIFPWNNVLLDTWRKACYHLMVKDKREEGTGEKSQYSAKLEAVMEPAGLLGRPSYLDRSGTISSALPFGNFYLQDQFLPPSSIEIWKLKSEKEASLATVRKAYVQQCRLQQGPSK